MSTSAWGKPKVNKGNNAGVVQPAQAGAAQNRPPGAAAEQEDKPPEPGPTLEPQVLAELHKKGGVVSEMVGRYNPNERDPSLTMLHIADRNWEEDKLERGCQLLNNGVGLNKAAREAGVLSGTLKQYWIQHYSQDDEDDEEDYDDDYM